MTTLAGIQRKALICPFHGDDEMSIAPINPLTAGLLDIAFIRYEHLYVEDNIDFIVDSGDFVVDR